MRAIIKFKEVGKSSIGSTTYVGENLTKEKMVDFFGLKEPDITWYNVEIED